MSTDTHQNKVKNPIITYLKGSIEELKKVTWPSKQETWRKSWIVIAFSTTFAVFLGTLDFALNKLLEVIL
jgi:preprotein translocase subunit SecE